MSQVRPVSEWHDRHVRLPLRGPVDDLCESCLGVDAERLFLGVPECEFHRGCCKNAIKISQDVPTENLTEARFVLV
jgi:hypothetical protein